MRVAVTGGSLLFCTQQAKSVNWTVDLSNSYLQHRNVGSVEQLGSSLGRNPALVERDLFRLARLRRTQCILPSSLCGHQIRRLDVLNQSRGQRCSARVFRMMVRTSVRKTSLRKTSLSALTRPQFISRFLYSAKLVTDERWCGSGIDEEKDRAQ